MKEFLNEFISNITPGQFEGMVVYFNGTVATTVAKLYYRKEWTRGLKGKNKEWDPPEVALALLLIFIDHVVMGHVFLGFSVDNGMLFFLAIWFLYGLTGRWGLEWLARMKGTTVVKTSFTETEETKTTNES